MVRVRAVSEERGVSNVVGLTILVSLSIVGSLAIVAAGGMALNAISEETQDGLARDSMANVDARLSALTDASVDASTTFTIPQGAGDSIEANGSSRVEVRVETAGRFTGSVVENDGQCSYNMTLGTITQESRTGDVLIYEGGALFRQRSSDVVVESRPNFDFNATSGSIAFSFVSMANLPTLYGGQELEAQRRIQASREATQNLRDELSDCWNIVNTATRAPVDVTVTFDSEYAEGWLQYANNSVGNGLPLYGAAPTADRYARMVDDNTVVLNFGTIGQSLSVPETSPSNFSANRNLIYSGLSQYAVFNSEIAAFQGGFVVDANNAAIAVYDQSTGQWTTDTDPGGVADDFGWYEADLITSTFPDGPPGSDRGYIHRMPDDRVICVAKSNALRSNNLARWCEDRMIGVDASDLQSPDPRGNFAVQSATVLNSPLYEGEDLRVRAEIENNGDAPATKTVALQSFDGSIVATQSVTIGPGGSETVTLSWSTEPGDAGDGQVTVGTPDSAARRAATVRESGEQFDISLDSTSEPVTEGETLVVETTVTNTGTGSGTQYVALADFRGNVVDYEQVSLGQGTSQSVTLRWDTGIGDNGTGPVTVATEDTTDTATGIQVRQGGDVSGNANFEVDIASLTDEVTEGDDVTVTADVENTGTAQGTQYVSLRDFDGDLVDVAEVTLDSGSATTETLTWETRQGDSETGVVIVESENDGTTRQVEVEDATSPGEFTVDDVVWTNSSVAEGEVLEIEADVENNDDDRDTQYVVLRDFDGDIVAFEEVTLAGGETRTVALQWATDAGSAGSGDVSVATGTDSESVAVTVDEGLYSGVVYVGQASSGTEHLDETGSGWELDDTYRYQKWKAESGDWVVSNGPVSGSTAVCIATDDAGMDPEQNCGEVREPTTYGNLSYDGGANALDVNGTTGDLRVLTTQVGNATTLENETVDQVRVPVDVFFVLDESGSMLYDPDGLRDYDYVFDRTLTVPSGEVYYQVDSDTYYGPGETFEADYTWVYEYGTGSDPSEERLDATESFIGALQEPDRAGATQFDASATRMADLTGNLDAVNESLSTDPRGGTDISAGIYDGIDGLTATENPQERIMVVLSDGRDNRGGSEIAAAEAAAEANITIYTVGLGDAVDRDEMEAIAEETGGEYYQAENASELEEKFDIIANRSTTQTSTVIRRETTEVAAVTNGTAETTVTVGDSFDVNDPARFNGTESTAIEQAITEGLQNASLSFEVRVYGCAAEDLTGTNVTSTRNGNRYTHAYCPNPDESDVTTIDNSNVDNHVIVTNDNGNSLSDIDASEWWQPTPSAVTNIDESDLGDNEALVGLEVSADGQSGYVLLHFQMQERTVPPEYAGDVSDDGTIEDGEFTVTIDDTNATAGSESITEGQTLGVDVTVENTGDADAAKTVALENFDGAVVDSREATIASDDSETLELTWPTSIGDNGTDDVTVSTEDDSATAAVDVRSRAAATFDVAIAGANDPVNEGETMTVEATVTNTGSGTDTQYVRLKNFDDRVVDTALVTVVPGATETVTLSWETSPGDGGTGDVIVRSDDTTARETVTVQRGSASGTATFDIRITGTNSPVAAGNDLTVTAEVENTGSGQGTQVVSLRDPTGSIVDSQAVTVDPNDDAVLTLTWSTEAGDAGTHVVTATTDDAAATREVTVTEAGAGGLAQFEVAGVTTNSPVAAGNDLTVTAEVENTGTAEGTQYVRLLDVDGNLVDYEPVSLAAGGRTDVSLTWETASEDTGTGDITLATDDRTAREQVTVEDRAPETGELIDGGSTIDPLDTDVTEIDISG